MRTILPKCLLARINARASVTSPSGKVVLINPFVTNPDSPVKVEDFPKVDIIVVADGHQDEVGSAAEIALATHAKVITSFEMYSVWFEPRKVALEQIVRSSPGDWTKDSGITIRNIGSSMDRAPRTSSMAARPWAS